jgi:hypothetical protein
MRSISRSIVWPLLRTLLLARLQGPFELAVDEVIAEDSRGGPSNAIGPSSYARRLLVKHKDVAGLD